MDLKLDERKSRFEYSTDKRLSLGLDDGYEKAFGWNVCFAGNADRKKMPSLDCEIEVQLRKDIGNMDKDLIFNVNRKKEYR